MSAGTDITLLNESMNPFYTLMACCFKQSFNMAEWMQCCNILNNNLPWCNRIEAKTRICLTNTSYHNKPGTKEWRFDVCSRDAVVCIKKNNKCHVSVWRFVTFVHMTFLWPAETLLLKGPCQCVMPVSVQFLQFDFLSPPDLICHIVSICLLFTKKCTKH